MQKVHTETSPLLPLICHVLIVVCSVQWIFWVGPLIGAAIAAAYHQYVLRASAAKLGSYRSN
jgi:hypothetical protein